MKIVKARKKLLWVGDACCPSGFARATHEILDVVKDECDVTVLGLNYGGDPNPFPYHVYSCFPGGDPGGIGRLVWMCDLVKPDVIVLQNDGFNMPYYVQALRKKTSEYQGDYAEVPIIAAVAVDGLNFRGAWLKGISHAIFWTQFALDEARAGGYEGPASVIPLGVDVETFYPVDKFQARIRRGWPEANQHSFVVGNVNRNQVRKRWDLTVRYFARWVKEYQPDDAWLYFHTAPTNDTGGPNVAQLVDFYQRHFNVKLNFASATPQAFYGDTEEQMRDTYNSFDVDVTTTQGEGMGLTTMEAMACAVPCILPEHSSFGKGGWVDGAAEIVPCTSSAINPNGGLNILGGVVDEDGFVAALNRLYSSWELRKSVGQAGLARVTEQRFRWPEIGRAYLGVLEAVLDPKPDEEVWRDLGRPEEATL